ncbi:MAG: NAD-dependent epimerase/dehydratase family protein [Thermoanaerobaculia bacterium]
MKEPSLRVFITGATGYIGSALARRLIEDGHQLTALVRSASRTASLEALGVRCVVGDITDRYSMREGMSGADWVIHAAAELDLDADPQKIRSINVAGSENVASLAFKLGVGRLMSISSVAYFGGSPADGSPANETAVPIEPFPTHYSAAKHAGEQAIQRWAAQGLEVVTIYPSLVYGPPGKKQGANAVLRAILKGRLPVLVAGHRITTWIYLDDLVEGIVLALNRAEAGDKFLLAGDRADLATVVRKVCQIGEVAPPKFELPLRVAQILGRVAAPYFRWRGYRSPLSQEQLRSLTRHWSFEDSYAREKLSWSPRSLDEGLPPAIRHLLNS